MRENKPWIHNTVNDTDCHYWIFQSDDDDDGSYGGGDNDDGEHVPM